MGEETDKRNLWKVLQDPNYLIWIPEHKKIIKDIAVRKEVEKKQLTDAMTKLLGKFDE